MAPTIVFDREQRPVVAIGTPGADRIIGYVAQALVAMLDWGMSPQQALAMGMSRIGTVRPSSRPARRSPDGRSRWRPVGTR